jgi:hypothetical protein
LSRPRQRVAKALSIHRRYRPIERDLIRERTTAGLAAEVEPYIRADGTRIWSLMQLERQLPPKAYGRRRGGYLDRRRTNSANA